MAWMGSIFLGVVSARRRAATIRNILYKLKIFKLILIFDKNLWKKVDFCVLNKLILMTSLFKARRWLARAAWLKPTPGRDWLSNMFHLE